MCFRGGIPNSVQEAQRSQWRRLWSSTSSSKREPEDEILHITSMIFSSTLSPTKNPLSSLWAFYYWDTFSLFDTDASWDLWGELLILSSFQSFFQAIRLSHLYPKPNQSETGAQLGRICRRPWYMFFQYCCWWHLSSSIILNNVTQLCGWEIYPCPHAVQPLLLYAQLLPSGIYKRIEDNFLIRNPFYNFPI